MVKCQGQKVKYQHKDLITRNIHVKYQLEALALTIQSQSIQNAGQIPRSRSQGKKLWYLRKGSDTKNTHVKYQSFSTHFSNVINKVKVVKK